MKFLLLQITERSKLISTIVPLGDTVLHQQTKITSLSFVVVVVVVVPCWLILNVAILEPNHVPTVIEKNLRFSLSTFTIHSSPANCCRRHARNLFIFADYDFFYLVFCFLF